MKTMRKTAAGFTLVEVMVAMTIGLFVLAGLIVAFSANKDTFRYNEQLLRLQDSARFAMDSMVQDLRMAADVGCLRAASDMEDKLDTGNIKFPDPNTLGFSKDDLIKGVTLTADADGTHLDIYGIPIDDTLQLQSNCESTSIGKIAKYNTTDPKYDPANPDKTWLDADVSNPSYIAKSGKRRYTFTGSFGNYRLESSDAVNGDKQLLLNHIDDFLICFGLDNGVLSPGATPIPENTMDGRVDQWKTVPPALAADDPETVVAVTIQFVAVSVPGRNADSMEGDFLSAETPIDTIEKKRWCDGEHVYPPPGTPADKRLRKFFSATAHLRNKVANGYGKNGWLAE